jgi:hypothetical protein
MGNLDTQRRQDEWTACIVASGEHSHLTIMYITGVHLRYVCKVVYQRNSTKDLPLAGCDGSCTTTFANTCPDLPVFFIAVSSIALKS